uniref:Palmitoyltransferase n=1 Tax=Panagrellus redivivus TaxID=6233 RepID=A0A7E4VXD0_PANRE
MNLSQRYQLSENLRIVLFLRNLFGLYFCCNLVVLAAFFVYWLSDELYFKLFINFVWQILIFIYAGFLIVVFSSAGVWPTIMQLWKKLKGDLGPDSETTCNNKVFSIKSSIGEQMMFQLDQEADVYFGQLTQSWGEPNK